MLHDWVPSSLAIVITTDIAFEIQSVKSLVFIKYFDDCVQLFWLTLMMVTGLTIIPI